MDVTQIFPDPITQGFVPVQRAFGNTGTFHVAPDKFVGIEIRRIGGSGCSSHWPSDLPHISGRSGRKWKRWSQTNDLA